MMISTRYEGYDICVVEHAARFIPRVTRPGALIAHDGGLAQSWSSRPRLSYARALEVAMAAIDTQQIR